MTLPIDKILQGDCIEILNNLPEKSVDLIFADPPYNLQLSQDLWRPNMTKVDAVTDSWDKFDSFEAYDAFTRAWLGACRRVLKDTGTIWVIGSYHNIYRVGAILMDLGYWILNDVIWIKKNPMPNFRGARFTNAHETLIWAKKHEKAKYRFNYQSMKHLNGGKQMRSDWEIPICSGEERIKINGEKVHPTQKPEALLERILLASSIPGDVILDPFIGTGTTSVVAKRLKRYWIGIERDDHYFKIANKRIASVLVDDSVELPQGRRDLPRVGIKKLVASNYIQIGQRLYSFDRKYQAIVSDKLELICDNIVGSIHEVAGRVLGKSRQNGWDFWFYEDTQGNLVSIDYLRNQYRKNEMLLY